MGTAKGVRPPNAGKGRKKGVQNKLTRSVKQAFEHVFQDLQKKPDEPYALGEWGKREPDKFYALAAKLIPAEIKGNLGVTVTPNVNLIIRGMSGEAVGTVETEPLGVGGRKPGRKPD